MLSEITMKNSPDQILHKENVKLLKILQNLPLGLSIEDGNSLFFNKALVEMIGYTPEEVPDEETWYQKVYPDESYREFVKKEWKEKVLNSHKNSHKSQPIQTKVLCKDGTFKIIESIYQNVENEFITLYKDVTEQYKTEEKLKEINKKISYQNQELVSSKIQIQNSERKLIEAQKASKTGNWETDLETLQVIWSAETYAIFELDAATFSPTHQSFLKFVHPDDKEMVDNAFIKSFESKTYNSIEHRIITSKGNTKYVEERWKVSFDFEGKPKLVFGTCQDITERKLIELELIETRLKVEENEHRLKLAVSAANLGVWEGFIEEKLMIFDDKMFEIYGIEKINNNFHYDDWKKILHPEDKERAVFESYLILENNEPFNSTFRIIKSDGQVAHIKSDAIVIKDENGNPQRIIGVNRDITEIIRSENVLKENELKYRTLFESSDDAILLLKDNRWVDCNESAIKLFGSSRAQLLSKNLFSYFPKYQPDGTPSKEGALQKIALSSGGSSQHFEWVHCKENGTMFTTDVRLNQLEIEGEKYIQVILRDISEAKILENKLNEFRYFFEKSNDLLAVTDVDGYFEYVNACFQNTLEYTEEELRQKEYDEIFVPEFIDDARKKAVDLRSGIPLENYSAKMLKKNGESIWVEWNVFINEFSGKFYAIGRDISEWKKHEEALALASLIVNSSHDAIMSISIDNKIISWNKGAEKMFGYQKEEIIGKSIFQLIPENIRTEQFEISEKITSNGLLDYYETQRIRKDGKIIDVSLTVSPILDESGKLIATSKIMRNITSQKNIEKEKKQIVNDLIQRNRDLEQFTNIISHNLRAPVANIIGINDYMMQKDISEDKKHALDNAMNQSVLTLDNVIRDLTLILQVRRDINEQKTDVSFYDLVDKIKTSISNEIIDKNVQILVDFSQIDTMTTIKSYLYSIFFNLISNSIKYRQADKIPVIEIKSEKVASKIILKFKDNGLGFDNVKSGNQVFGLYKRFHKHVEGKGMGLFMVKSQVESLGGKISVTSELNVGTEFTIEFNL